MPFRSYVAELKTIRSGGQATENSYYTALGSLIEDLDPSVAVIINPKKTPHGSPDFRRVAQPRRCIRRILQVGAAPFGV